LTKSKESKNSNKRRKNKGGELRRQIPSKQKVHWEELEIDREEKSKRVRGLREGKIGEKEKHDSKRPEETLVLQEKKGRDSPDSRVLE